MSQITILNQANVPMGPFTRDQVADKLQKREVTMSSLAFVEGLSQWSPLADVLARVDAVAPLVSPVAPAPPVAAPVPTAAYSYAATMQPPPHLVYAGFWQRFIAYLIDGFVLTVVASVAMSIFMMILSVTFGIKVVTFDSPSSTSNDPAKVVIIVVAEIVIWLFFFVLFWIYFAWLESSSWQATLGKKALGLRVTDMTGATDRFLARHGPLLRQMHFHHDILHRLYHGRVYRA